MSNHMMNIVCAAFKTHCDNTRGTYYIVTNDALLYTYIYINVIKDAEG